MKRKPSSRKLTFKLFFTHTLYEPEDCHKIEILNLEVDQSTMNSHHIHVSMGVHLHFTLSRVLVEISLYFNHCNLFLFFDRSIFKQCLTLYEGCQLYFRLQLFHINISAMYVFWRGLYFCEFLISALLKDST